MKTHNHTLLQSGANTYVSASALTLSVPIMIKLYRVEVVMNAVAVSSAESDIFEVLSCYDQPTTTLAYLDDERTVCNVTLGDAEGLSGSVDYTGLPGGGLMVPGKIWLAFNSIGAAAARRVNVRLYYDEVEVSTLAYTQDMAART